MTETDVRAVHSTAGMCGEMFVNVSFLARVQEKDNMCSALTTAQIKYFNRKSTSGLLIYHAHRLLV